ncbi:MAG: hypothetical protein KIS68_04610 [Bauldia sp.]|nr:hypothetical protein [Bauldia sp.]
MLRISSIISLRRKKRRFIAAAAAVAIATGVATPVVAQETGQSVAQLVADGFQVLAFVQSQMGQGYAVLLANYGEETLVMLLCNINLNSATRQMETSSCFEVL